MPTAAETPDRPAGDLPAGAALAQQMIRIGYLSRATGGTGSSPSVGPTTLR